jgi:hypothetical protein
VERGRGGEGSDFSKRRKPYLFTDDGFF